MRRRGNETYGGTENSRVLQAIFSEKQSNIISAAVLQTTHHWLFNTTCHESRKRSGKG
jgi:hypothetical protein